jgi:hypothetical protein
MTNVHTFKNIDYYHSHRIIICMVTLVTEVTNVSLVYTGILHLPAFLQMPLLLKHTKVGSFCYTVISMEEDTLMLKAG